MAGVHGAGGDAAGSRTFEDAKSTLYGTISAAGAALEKASKRRESTVSSVAAYLDRIQLDLSGLSVIHVTGTKGKGSTCAMVESVLRHHGFRTGLYTSPHLLEVTERVRCDGKPLTKEAFARYFFQVWDRLQDTAARTNTANATAAAAAAGTGTTGIAAAASEGPSQAKQPAAPEEEGTTAPEMPTYFHLLTLVGLWCFVQEGVDVCVLEVGMGGRFDATNVVPSPVACGVAMLDLDHTQVLGDTLDKIAWEKGGIFKKGCRAMAVEQPRGGMSVLRECAAAVGCGELEVVKPLPALDPCGRAYEIGLAGDHQRVNAALALRLCAVWMEAHRQQQQQQQQQQQHEEDQAPPPEKIRDPEAFWASAEVHRGLSRCVWPGRCQVFRPPAFPSVTIYLDGAHTEQSMHACLAWFVEKTATAAAASRAEADEVASSRAAVAVSSTPRDMPRSSPPPPPPPQLEHNRQRRRCRRVLWFNASHERDVVPLLDMLASARRREPCSGGASGNATNTTDKDGDADGDAPLFDEAWFMEVNPGRPSRFKPPTAQEILAPHGMSPAVAAASATPAGIAGASSVGYGPFSDDPRGQEPSGGAAPGCGEEKAGGAGAGSGAGAWQRTLEQVWTSLQTRRGGTLSATLTGTAPFFFEKLSICANSQHGGGSEAASVVGDPGVSSRAAASAIDAVHNGSGGRGDSSVAATGCGGRGGRVDSEIVEVLCTGSLYAVAAALEAFGAEVA